MLNKANPSHYPWYLLFVNSLSITGLVITLVAGVFHLSLFVLDFSRGVYNPYLNIWFHIILPPFVVAGFGLAIYGAWRKRRKIKKSGIPLTKSGQGHHARGLILSGTLTAVLIVPFLGLTTYTGYKYTDSVNFCGQACHTPMNPVFTAYQVSPHARVPCSSCHIGEGASWFVRSKLSGTRQVFATAFDTFHRPIETPIKDLRPARETCERCHWPEKAFGSKVVDLPHFACDENNTRRPLSMLLKTGGGDPELAEVRGIHWHLLSTHKTEYVAVDDKRMEIPWVRVVQDNVVRVFRSDGLPVDAPPPEGEFRVMDCLDCHNRPSHNYRTPDALLNNLFNFELLDTSFPYLKREAARLMAQPYEDTPAAREEISQGLNEYYLENYPEIIADRGEELARNISAVLGAFEKNIFPEMKTDWRTHPDHIGHKYFPGCFRCHDDRHVAADGSVISRECGQCHEFMEHKKMEGGQVLVRGGYKHPYKLEKSHEHVDCHACHDGGPTPPPTCEGCHSEITDFIAGTASILAGVTGEPHPHHGELECVDCHEEARRFSEEEIVPLCEDCHDEEEHAQTLRGQLAELAEIRGKVREPVPPAVDALERVRPIHNLDYALKILRRLED
jgi:hypothetical protein